MDSDLTNAGLGTIVATGVTWGITRILSYYRKKTTRFANIKPVYISFVVSIIVILIMNFLKLIPGDMTIGKAIIQIFTATLMSGGLQANINDFRGHTGAASHMIKGITPEAYSDYDGNEKTLVVDADGIHVPIEQYVIPNFHTKVLVEKILPISLRGRSLRAIDMLASELYRYYEPDLATRNPIYYESPRWSSDLLINSKSEMLGYLEYTLLEHAVLATLFGSDYIRTVYCKKDLFNVFYFGSTWRYVSSGDECILDYKCTMISHRGVLEGSDYKLKIKKAKYKEYKDIDNALVMYTNNERE